MAFSDPAQRDLAARDETRRLNGWRAGAFDYQRLDAYVVAREALRQLSSRLRHPPFEFSVESPPPCPRG
jgi:hypothetical protein